MASRRPRCGLRNHALLSGPPGGAEPAATPRGPVQRVDGNRAEPRGWRDDKLRDALAMADRSRISSEIDEQHLYLAAIILVHRAGAVQHHQPVAKRKPRARADLPLMSPRQGNGEAGRHQNPRQRGQAQPLRAIRRREAGAQIQPRRPGARIMRQFQRRIVIGQDKDRKRICHCPAPVSLLAAISTAAIRSASSPATAAFEAFGQASSPSRGTSVTVFSWPPITPLDGLTSLATIQSAPLAASFARAFVSRSDVSAANPITRPGRSPEASVATERSTSGFSSSSSGGIIPLPSFFSFSVETSLTRQSPTAAAKMAASAGRAAWTAALISAAVSTGTTCTPMGGGSATGPETSTTSAPRSRSAEAIALP